MRKLGEESVVGDFIPDLVEEESGSGARNARLGSVTVTEVQGKKARLGKNTRGKSRGTRTMARARVIW